MLYFYVFSSLCRVHWMVVNGVGDKHSSAENCGPPIETKHTAKQSVQHRPGKLAGTQSQEWLQPEGELKCVAALNRVHKKSKNGCKSRGTLP